MYTAGLQSIITRDGLSGYFYADDSQVRHSDHPQHSESMKIKIKNCIKSIDNWMASNRLKLNPVKTELMWCGSAHQCKSVTTSPFKLGGASISPVTTVRLLGVQLDSDLSMSSQVSSTIRSCFYQLRRLRPVRRCLTVETSKTVVNALILSRMDYCNSILTGVTQRQCDRLQTVLNAAAKIIYGGAKYDHVTPTLRDKLHWLKFQQRITFKLCLLVFKSLHNRAPRYIKDLVVPLSNQTSTRRLRSATSNMLRKPATKKKMGERGFSVAGPAAWNALPLELRTCSTIDSFKSQLKTHLFQLSYP
jgi:hypothetical protein